MSNNAFVGMPSVGGTAAEDWSLDALCAQTDPEGFFPEKGESTKTAKKICAACTVRSECLNYALVNSERFGVWGGFSERERRAFSDKRGDAA